MSITVMYYVFIFCEVEKILAFAIKIGPKV